MIMPPSSSQQNSFHHHQQPGRTSLDRDGGALQPPNGGSSRKLSASTISFAPRGSSLNPSAGLGSFSSDLRSQTMSSRAGSRAEVGSVYPGSFTDKVEEDDAAAAERALAVLKDKLNREMKIKEGSENMLEALNIKKAKQTKDQRQRVEAELSASNSRIKELRQKISDAQRPKAAPPTTPTRSRNQDGLLQSNGLLRSPPSISRSAIGSDIDEMLESPTFLLAELLQALEVEAMPPEYYVSRANQLVELFKRHPAIKYDLVWSIFGLRMQMMLLSESREVVAAGYRTTRYAITDVASLKKIRSLNVDYLVIRSLNNYRKADVEREQALKFVRAFLDVKGGVREVSRAVVRTIVAVAEQSEDRRPGAQVADHNIDRLRPICIETLAEIMVQDPRLLIASGGLGPLCDALAEGAYKAPESLVSAFLFLLDTPGRRGYMQSGYGLEVVFTAFTDQLASAESILKQNSRAISVAMKSWSGLMALCMYDFRPIRSLIASILFPSPAIRETVLDLFFSLLRIKSPAWATSFLAGRRLTTYGRVANMKSASGRERSGTLSHEEDTGEQNFVDHYTALLLAVFIKAGLLQSLLRVAQSEEEQTLKRKTTLLIGEVLKLASRLLPPSWSAELQLLPELFAAAAQFGNDAHFVASGIVYQISSVSRTLYRSSPSESMAGALPSSDSMQNLMMMEEHPKANTAVAFDDATFRQLLIDTGVLNSSNYLKWNWDVIVKVIDGPLQTGKRLEEAIKASKFMKRIMSFYRPFKYKFADIRSTRNTHKYVKAGCALVHSLLQSPEGIRVLADSKLLRQIAECLAHGLTAQFPMFAKDRLTDTLCGGYFPMLGVLSSDANGLLLLERWRMFNMMYHIIDLKQRPDLIKLLLSNFDYSLKGHPRVLLSKALVAGTKEIRIHATNTLRKCTMRPVSSLGGRGNASDAKWAIQLLVTQLYDPEIEVCSTAVKILENACNRKTFLECIVECRPALDHLGEIGAPLLLRFLSTSIGYHYLDGLDYISNEMDDWFLGRNDSYVDVIEASLARAFLASPDDHGHRGSLFDEAEAETDYHDSHVPPHFYRELTRTREGCKLLSDKGHFEEFATTIRDHGMQTEDGELMTKVKGCLWAVGNVGSMELGAPFLESSDVVEQIVRLAESHEVMSLRGTAFFVLGLISRSTHGLEMLSEHGWDANTTSMGASLGFCMPNELSKLFSLKPWKHVKAASIELPDTQRTVREQPEVRPARPPLAPSEMPPVLGDADVNERIMELIVDLGNMVLYKKALTDLQRLRQRKPKAFRSVDFFKKVMGLMEWNHYRLGVRRLVIDLFEKNVMRQIVFGGGGGGGDGEGVAARGHVEAGDDGEDSNLRSLNPRWKATKRAIKRGLEAGQKVLAAQGCYAMTATTALTVQDTTGVHGIHVVPAEFVERQMDACLKDIGADVIVTGMLATADTIEAVSRQVTKHGVSNVVVDPVVVSTSGAQLLPHDAVRSLIKYMLPQATVLTPNIPEAELLLEEANKHVRYEDESDVPGQYNAVQSIKDFEALGRRLQALGPTWVLVKGGHVPLGANLKAASTAAERAVVMDALCGPDGYFLSLQSPWQDSTSTHGTGCSLAAAIASGLAQGSDVPDAVRMACRYVEAAIRAAPGLGSGHGPLGHFHSTFHLPFSPGYFIEYLLARPDVSSLWHSFVHHPFVKALGDGSLPLRSFKGYITQDYLFLIQFSRAYALAAYKANNVADMNSANSLSEYALRETQLHVNFCASFGISLLEMEATEEHQACTAYTRYVLDVGHAQDLVALHMALAPCMLGYAAAARMLRDDPGTRMDGNPYREWIRNYTGDDSSGAVAQCSRQLEDMMLSVSPSRVEELVCIFIHATKMEMGFWNMFPYA
ncbi:hypothetical protein CP532_5088 [Ophiocordyceps camponoti-leonardi (nom. inval.)]|nr:hypothetical protein CP532_5088 [Ophiocordyceps camponoti-leonardi (nom. inval.)]